MLGPVFECDVPILWMGPKEHSLTFERIRHALVGVDVPLRAVDDADEAQLERVHTPCEHVECVCARVHQVELREDTDRPLALGVDGSREL